MIKKNAILIFDIGKTNKKVLLFDQNLKILVEEEIRFPEIIDDDGFPCEDIIKIENWIDGTLVKYLNHPEFNLAAVNFTTYGATLIYIDEKGKRLTPVYNYLKSIPENIVEPLYDNYGGVAEFSRCTASPALGMLNSGLQIWWLKKDKPDIFNKTKAVLHYPQYLSFRLAGKITSEHTSIGCHTAIWNFDTMKYHAWLKNEGINLPEPGPVNTIYKGNISDISVNTGIGIHDTSASLVPFLKSCNEEFVLISTGTWCISMNPFNHFPLTAEQLENDCLCNLSINQKPVKSSRVFLGNIHDKNVERLTRYFKVNRNQYEKVKIDESLIKKMLSHNTAHPEFFRKGVSENYIDAEIDMALFEDFDTAYHRLMIDLTNLVIESLNFIIPENDAVHSLFISGGFAKNKFFTRLLATHFKNKKVYTSDINNTSSLGAALVVYDQFRLSSSPALDFALKKVEPFTK